MIAIAGSPFKAVNRNDRHVSEKNLKPWLEPINAKIDVSLKALDEQDRLEVRIKHLTPDELKEKMVQFQSRKHQDEGVLQQLAARGTAPLSCTDADRRSMKTQQGTAVCDHVPLAVDHQPKLIVAHEVTNAVTDHAQLAAMATRAKAMRGTDQRAALAAMGDDHGDDVNKGWQEASVPSIPTPNTSANSQLGRFGNEAVVYDAQSDGDRCPAGQDLTFRLETVEPGRQIRYYSTSACQEGP